MATAKNVSWIASAAVSMTGLGGAFRTTVEVRTRKGEEQFPGLAMFGTGCFLPAFFWDWNFSGVA